MVRTTASAAGSITLIEAPSRLTTHRLPFGVRAMLRGALSDLLSRQTAEAMTRRGPKARLVEIEGVGHAPTLIAQEQIDVVASFLLNP